MNNNLNAWASRLNLTPPPGHMINRAALLQELVKVATQPQQPAQETAPSCQESVQLSHETEQLQHPSKQVETTFSDSGATLSAEKTSCLGTSSSANFNATAGGADLNVRSHRGNTAKFSVGPGGPDLNITRGTECDRPSHSQFLAAFQANFGC